MAIKRIYDCFIEDIPCAEVEHAVAKMSRTNRSGDEADLAMMLLRYSQQQQQQQQQQPVPMSVDMAQCTSCIKPFMVGANHQTSACRKCSRTVCPSCIQPCCCCSGKFCSSCLMTDYVDYDIQTVCLDCN